MTACEESLKTIPVNCWCSERSTNISTTVIIMSLILLHITYYIYFIFIKVKIIIYYTYSRIYIISRDILYLSPLLHNFQYLKHRFLDLPETLGSKTPGGETHRKNHFQQAMKRNLVYEAWGPWVQGWGTDGLRHRKTDKQECLTGSASRCSVRGKGCLPTSVYH